MATFSVPWVKSQPIDLREISESCGFHLKKSSNYSGLGSKVKSVVISAALKQVENDWNRKKHKNSKDYKDVVKGVYIISLGSKLAVSYPWTFSPVIYIGRGTISNRFYNHFHHSLYDFSLSLQDIELIFYITEVKKKGSPNLFKDVEAMMIDRFVEKTNVKPLLNKISGRQGTVEHTPHDGWDKPLNNKGKKYSWIISPSNKKAPWFKEMTDY